MKITIKTEDQKEAMRHVKALDMALALFQIQGAYKHKETVEEYREAISQIFDLHNIILDDLIE